ncbi:response regulator [Taibaiella koreensis]|uniref:hypothetical protein n=1 Tax=Taibaiella koreensis TaxID=1268548 RepID=UPI0019695B6E|nr:hypothetical protein [Taibaiella koreensis]
MAFIIQGIFPDAALVYADTHQQCLQVLGKQKVALMICDGKIGERHNLDLIRQARLLQPGMKTMMLLEENMIDCCIPKKAPIDRIQEAILEMIPSAGAFPGNI